MVKSFKHHSKNNLTIPLITFFAQFCPPVRGILGVEKRKGCFIHPLPDNYRDLPQACLPNGRGEQHCFLFRIILQVSEWQGRTKLVFLHNFVPLRGDLGGGIMKSFFIHSLPSYEF